VRGAEPGDILEARIIDVKLRGCCNPEYKGKAFGSNAAALAGTALADLQYPLLETQDEWVAHGFSFPNYLAQLGGRAQSEIYSKSSIDLAMRDAFRKMRHFLMTTKGLSEDEAISLMSVAVDFGVTQVVDGNWGVHAIIKKAIFAGGEPE
jgi:acetamidase/formamidase